MPGFIASKIFHIREFLKFSNRTVSEGKTMATTEIKAIVNYSCGMVCCKLSEYRPENESFAQQKDVP